jgi:hypothetical protein
MYLNLTNASPAHRGMKISINRDLVVTMHNSLVTREDGTMESVTFIFCPPHGNWEVQEDYNTVLAQLNS